MALLLILLVALYSLMVPVRWFSDKWNSSGKLQKMVNFGQYFEARSIPEIQALNPPRESKFGYDAQFYVQMAFDPFFLKQETGRAMDNAVYRARRVGMPLVTYPWTFLDHRFALKFFTWINPLCWVLLLVLIWRMTGLSQWRDWNCLMACALGSGVLFSVQRSLTDLPSAVLTLSAVLYAGAGSGILFALSLLTKETACLSLPAAWSGPFLDRSKWVRNGLKIFLILLPVLCWFGYITWKLQGDASGSRNFDWPCLALFREVAEQFVEERNQMNWTRLFRMLAPLSLLAQSVYLIQASREKWNEPLWRMGIGFAVLLLFLGDGVWEGSTAAMRVVIPLSLSFNLLLRSEKPLPYGIWFFLGNLGMFAEFTSMCKKL